MTAAAGGNGDAAAQRAEARARRRAEQARRRQAAEGDEARGEGEDSQETHHGRALDAARSAATAAAVGAAVGAARAFMTRHDHQQGDAETLEDQPESEREQEEPSAAAPGEEQQPVEEPHGRADEREDEEEDEAQVPAAEPAEERGPVPHRRDRRHDDVQSAPPRGGVARDRVRTIVTRAREHLRDLQGSDAESVSSLERRNGGWVVTLEVVEVRRVPESTDVLASYAVELDDQGDLVAYERLRRYYRAQGAVGDDR